MLVNILCIFAPLFLVALAFGFLIDEDDFDDEAHPPKAKIRRNVDK